MRLVCILSVDINCGADEYKNARAECPGVFLFSVLDYCCWPFILAKHSLQ